MPPPVTFMRNNVNYSAVPKKSVLEPHYGPFTEKAHKFINPRNDYRVDYHAHQLLVVTKEIIQTNPNQHRALLDRATDEVRMMGAFTDKRIRKKQNSKL